MKPLAYLILGASRKPVEVGGPSDAEYLAEKVAKWNRGTHGDMPYRLVPVAEIPAWQPIEAAPRDGTPLLVARKGGRALGASMIDGQGIVYFDDGRAVHLRNLGGAVFIECPRPKEDA